MPKKLKPCERPLHTPERVALPTQNAFARLRLQTLFTAVIRPNPEQTGYQDLTGGVLRILFHLISRMQWGNKVTYPQAWLAKDIGITPPVYCRGISTLESLDFVRKWTTESNGQSTNYLILNPIFVQYFSKEEYERTLSFYNSLTRKKSTSRIQEPIKQKSKTIEKPINISNLIAQSHPTYPSGPHPVEHVEDVEDVDDIEYVSSEYDIEFPSGNGRTKKKRNSYIIALPCKTEKEIVTSTRQGLYDYFENEFNLRKLSNGEIAYYNPRFSTCNTIYPNGPYRPFGISFHQ